MTTPTTALEAARAARAKLTPETQAEQIESLIAGTDKLRHRAIRAHAAGLSAQKATLYAKACAGKLSPRQMIRAKCLECCGQDSKAVQYCSAYGCPLWVMRPGGGEADPSAAADPSINLGDCK